MVKKAHTSSIKGPCIYIGPLNLIVYIQGIYHVTEQMCVFIYLEKHGYSSKVIKT